MTSESAKYIEAFATMTLDLAKHVLSRPDNLPEVASYLMERVRELSGAHTVIMIQWLQETGGKHGHRLVDVNPERRRYLAESADIKSLIEIVHELHETTLWRPGTQGGEAESLLDRGGYGLCLAVPLNIGADRVGAILVLGLNDDRHVASIVKMQDTLSEVVALVLKCCLLIEQQEIVITDRKKAEEALQRRNQELSSVNVIAITVGRSLELERVLADTLRTVLDLMDLKTGWILLRQGQDNKLTLASHQGLASEFLREEVEEIPGDCIGFHVIQRKETLITENLSECPRLSRSLAEGETMASHACVPLISKNKVVGVMNVASEHHRPFSSEDLELLTAIGHQVGVAIQNARLFEGTRQKSLELKEAYERLKSLYEDLKAEREKTRSLRKALEDKFGLGNIVGKNDKMLAIYDLIEGVSQSDSTVLIQGESGTGKELIARAIQLFGPRKERPFVVANCSAYAQTLLESELFGHEKGAFTGAIRRKKGRFELADGGTIFLDEIGEIPPATQLLLLRVIQEKRFERVGGEDTIKVDVRVIAATNRNLARDMMEGRFREDLYYRLNVIPITVPPLRERRDDIALLARHFLEIYSAANNKPIRGFSEEVMQIFLDHDWPGNVRELQNVVEHAVILAKGDMITEIDLPHDLKETFPRAEAGISSLKDTEKNLILKVLKETEGNKYQAAKILGITRSTLYGKLRKHGIMVPSND